MSLKSSCGEGLVLFYTARHRAHVYTAILQRELLRTIIITSNCLRLGFVFVC